MIFVHGGEHLFFEDLARVIVDAIPAQYEPQFCPRFSEPFNNPNDLWVFNWMSWNNKRRLHEDCRNYIVYNTEILPRKLPLNPLYAEFMDKAIAVYDYSQTNVDYRPGSIYAPVGYSPLWDNKSYDILFYGTESDWRKEQVKALQDAGLIVYAAWGHNQNQIIYDLIRKSKLVISTPWAEDWQNDSCRIIPLMCSNIPVLAERTLDKEWWDWADTYPNVTVCDRDKLVETAIKILYKDRWVFPIPEKPWLK